jgi:hypothetical protein
MGKSLLDGTIDAIGINPYTFINFALKSVPFHTDKETP